MSKVLINYDQLCGLADHARRVGTLDAFADVALQWAGQADKEMERLTSERDELRRQLDPMGEYTSADELIAALRAEKAEDEAMKLDAQRYRWLRPRFFAADFAYSDPPVCAIVFRWPESAKISANLDREIDAAMGASNE